MNDETLYEDNSDIVEFNQPKLYFIEDRYVDKATAKNSGYIDLKILTVSNLAVGNGLFSKDEKGLYKDIMTNGEYPIIPGSSIKGAVRHIANIVSDGCLKAKGGQDGKHKYIIDVQYDKCNKERKCIICDMFGMMGVKSKLVFSEAISKNAKTKIVEENSQKSPKLNSDKYGIETKKYERGKQIVKLKGYKIYFNEAYQYKAKKRIRIKAILPKTEFYTKIFFENLTDKELELLCFALGCSQTFNLKLGGFKNEGYGQVETSGNVIMDGKSTDAKLYAEKYKSKYKEFSRSINDVEEIMRPYGSEVKK